MKEYFSHDLHARNDLKLKRLFKELKLSGIGAYWCLIEMLFEEKGYIPLSEIENIAYELRVKEDFILKVLNGFELFSCDSEKFWSESALTRITFKNEKSVKASKSAKNRWEKHANALTQPNAIKVKESKVNEIKENNIELRKKDFYATLTIYTEKYEKELLRQFYEYWIEPSKSGKMMRFESERFWDISKRLATWKRNQKEVFSTGKESAQPYKIPEGAVR